MTFISNNTGVEELDGSPSIPDVTKIKFPNGTLTDNGDSTATYTPSVSGSGDVVGPASAVDSNFAAFDTTTGKLIKDSTKNASSFAPALGADDNYVTDAEKIVIGNTSGTNSGNETPTTIGTLIGGAGDATPNDSDFVATSLTAGGILKKITWTNVKAFLKTYFDTLYQATGSYLTSANIVATITNGVTTNAPSEDAVFDALALKLPLSGGTMSGNLQLGENTSLALDPAGSADGKYSGITISGTAGATLAFGDVIVLDVTASKWLLADANSAAAADGDARGLIGMCVLAATDTQTTTILLNGTCRADANFPALTITAPVYLSETAGDIVVAQPTTTDVVIRTLGFALTADEIYFHPSSDYITHT